MKQSELARRVKCHRATISLILSGKRSAGKELAIKLAQEVKGTKIMDWLFAKHIANDKLSIAVRRMK